MDTDNAGALLPPGPLAQGAVEGTPPACRVCCACVVAVPGGDLRQLLLAPWMALLVSRYLSNAASVVLRIVYSVKDQHNLLHSSPLLKKSCVRQVVPDEWLPLSTTAGGGAGNDGARGRGAPLMNNSRKHNDMIV